MERGKPEQNVQKRGRRPKRGSHPPGLRLHRGVGFTLREFKEILKHKGTGPGLSEVRVFGEILSCL